jgi:hypothetical protein
MTKSAVLEIFAGANRFISPDEVWVALQRRWDGDAFTVICCGLNGKVCWNWL